jgi:hypothetical protein
MHKSDDDSPFDIEQKRLRVLSPSAFSPGSNAKDDSGLSLYETSSSGTNSPSIDERFMSQRLPYFQHHSYPLALQHYQQMINSQFMNIMMNPHVNNPQVNLLRMTAPRQNQENDGNDEDKQIDVMTDDTSSNDSDDAEETSPKRSNFSISAILGLEKGDLKNTSNPATAPTACH